MALAGAVGVVVEYPDDALVPVELELEVRVADDSDEDTDEDVLDVPTGAAGAVLDVDLLFLLLVEVLFLDFVSLVEGPPVFVGAATGELEEVFDVVEVPVPSEIETLVELGLLE